RRPDDHDPRGRLTGVEADGPDLLIRGGTVVTAVGSRRADVAIRGGAIARAEPDLSGLAATARESFDADGLLVLPGCVDVHTHTRVASDAEPDRFSRGSPAAARGVAPTVRET